MLKYVNPVFKQSIAKSKGRYLLASNPKWHEKIILLAEE